MEGSIFPVKLVSEDISISFDFLSRLPPGETPVSAGCEVLVFSGIDASPGAILSGAATLSGTNILQDIIGGLPGVIYLINCEIVTNLGNTFINPGKLAVVSDNPFQP